MLNFFDRIIVWKKEGETLTEFAKRLGVSKALLNSWKTHWPKWQTLDRCAAALGVDIEALFFSNKKEETDGSKGPAS